MNTIRGFAKNQDDSELNKESKQDDAYQPLIDLIKNNFFFGQSTTEPFTTIDFIDFAHMNGFEITTLEMNIILNKIGYSSQAIPNTADKLWAVHLVL